VTVDEVFGALSDSTRRIIVEELAERDGQSLFEICGRLAMRHGIGSSRQTITRHIDVLEKAGVVRVERSGRSRLHFLQEESLEPLQTWIAKHSDRAKREEI
jgi:DNA-binding transcriptional ArsR family regulator